MLKKRLAVNKGKGFTMSTLVMKSPKSIPKMMRTQDSGNSFSRRVAWWKRILRIRAVMMKAQTST